MFETNDFLGFGRNLAGTTSSSGTCVPHNFSESDAQAGQMWGWQGWYVLADLFVLFTVLFFEWVPIEFAMVAAVLMMCAAQIITVNDMTQGFSNAGILAVACLFIVAEGLASTGAIDYFLGKLLGNPKTLGQALTRMMIPAAFCAAWISSTAVLALLIPVITRWSKRINQAPSLLFMPLCYAIHLGGTVTLVGTTTNLVIAGLASTYYCRTMGIFELSTVGLPVCIAGVGCLLLLSPKVLPDMKEFERRTSHAIRPQKSGKKKAKRRGPCGLLVSCVCYIPTKLKECISGKHDSENKGGNTTDEEVNIVEGESHDLPIPSSDFVFHALVPDNSPLSERSVDENGLRSLEGLFLTSVRRGNTIYSAVGPEFNIRSGDNLGFAGVADNFIPMCRAKGLIPVVEGEAVMGDEEAGNGFSANPLSSFTVEAVVRSESDLIGKTMKEVNFRTRYHASALAIHRAGEVIQATKLGTIPLKIGDVLVLIVGEKFDWQAFETKRDLKPRYEPSAARRQSDFSSVNFSQSASGAVAIGGALPLSTGVIQSTGADVDSNAQQSLNKKRDYVFSMRVSPTMKLQLVRPLHGLTLEEAGLRNIPGMRVVAISRGDKIDRAVGPDFVLESNDIIWFTGDRDGLSSIRRVPGLEDTDYEQVKKLKFAPQSRRLIEVVVSLQSDLLFKTVRESRFRTRFNAAIVAVQRHGQRVLSKIGDIELEPGDVLIIDAGPEFVKRFRSDPNFLVVSEVEASAPPRMDRFYIAALTSLGMVVGTAASGMEILFFALFACGIMLATGVLTRERAHKAVDWKIIITVAAAFGLSTAMTNTKVGDIIGRAITDLALQTNTGELGVLAVVMIFTEILCALITAKAGALLMFPIAASAAARLNIDPTRMIIALMLGSSDYTTPQGHQTNLMIYGPGAYVFSDYQKLGIPLEVFLNIVQLICLAFIDLWYITTIAAAFFLLLCIWIDQVLINRRSVRELVPSCTCCCRRRSKNARKSSAEKTGKQSDNEDATEDQGRATEAPPSKPIGESFAFIESRPSSIDSSLPGGSVNTNSGATTLQVT